MVAVMAALVSGAFSQAQSAANAMWAPTGPDGGDARRFAFSTSDPSRIYLGTIDSWIFVSTDGGSSWSRLARLSDQNNLVVDSLVVDRSDPRTLYAGVWVMDHPDGGIYISHDAGRTWAAVSGMQGQSVRALAQSRSNPRVLVAGTLRGVYRSDDAGASWREISPPDSTEIHEVESVAIDPYNPSIIYAGTWHLPWKTTDNGGHWTNIKEGLIVDSDVFSMVIDPSRPSVLYLSACSGIYRSDTAGEQFRKVQGIPSSARRTRVLTMDPADRNMVYAGTTEGLYKTQDGGDNWVRTTGPDVIINDVYVDPRNPRHVLLATDRSGVLASEDAGVGFQSSNTGFSQRQVGALLADAQHSGTVLAGVLNDKMYGGIFVTQDFGRTWKQESEGLRDRDVFELAQSDDGTILAGTSDGLFRRDGDAWIPANAVSRYVPAARSRTRATHATTHATRRAAAEKIARPTEIRGRVTALTVTGNTWYAATSQGIFRSRDRGEGWEPVSLSRSPYTFGGAGDYLALAASGKTIFAGRRLGMMASRDEGFTWQTLQLPAGLTALDSLALTPEGTLWAGGREGVFSSTDQGSTWTPFKRLPVVAISGLDWDASLKRVIVTSWAGTLVYAVDPADQTWKWWNTGWTVHSVSSLSGRLIAASLYSGVVMQPQPQVASVGGGMPEARK